MSWLPPLNCTPPNPIDSNRLKRTTARCTPTPSTPREPLPGPLPQRAKLLRVTTTSFTPTAALIVTKTHGRTSIGAGENDTYNIVVTNAGPSVISNALVTDSLPSALVGGVWTCNASAGSTCANAAGSGNISELVTLASGGTATFTVSGTVAASTSPGTLSNTVNVAMPSGSVDPTPANNVATDTTAIQQHAEIMVHKTDGASSAIPGQAIHYTVTVTNNGPSDVAGVAVVDTIPAELTGATWGCAASPGSSCRRRFRRHQHAGRIAGRRDRHFTIDATVVASALGTVSNTARQNAPPGVTDPVRATRRPTRTPSIRSPICRSRSPTSRHSDAGITVTHVAVERRPLRRRRCHRRRRPACLVERSHLDLLDERLGIVPCIGQR